MTFGVSALRCRLDADVLPALPGGVDWRDFLAWNGGVRPAFAGKYMIGSPWRWVHGEATSLIDPVVAGAHLRIAPIQAADPGRQAAADEPAQAFGDEDGKAIAAAITSACVVGDLGISSTGPTYVYLEVAAGTALSPHYWAAWATAVANAYWVPPVPVGGVAMPGAQPLLPCLATTFAQLGGKWTLPDDVRTALDGAAALGWANSRCHGLWASTVDPATVAFPPTLTWTDVAAYSQPQSAGSPTPVPVRIWRYATGDAAAPVHAVGRITLEATPAPAAQPDPTFDGMLTVQPWTAAAPPTSIGLDRGYHFQTELNCLKSHKLTIRRLPEKTPVSAAGPALATPLIAKPAFVIRYYSAGPRAAGQRPFFRPKDLQPDEATTLSKAGMSVVVVWQGRVDRDDIPGHLAKPGSGQADGLAAGWYAANVIGQPAHTPIYFAADCDVTTSGVGAAGGIAVSDKVLTDYFEGVAQGLEAYLAAQPPAARRPYAIGAYSPAHAFDVLYPRGLASHFWQSHPPTWGDQGGATRTNVASWPHANVRQVAMDYASDIQTSSGVMGCRAFSWLVQFQNTGGPAELLVTANSTTTTVPFPPKRSDMIKATKALVTVWTVEAGTTMMRVDFKTKPTAFQVAVSGAAPAGWVAGVDPVDVDGYTDINVAWGDPGGWRASTGAP